MPSSFWRDLNEGEINFRDNLQFELKSEFPVNSDQKENIFTEEFYLFIPDTLHIDETSYPNRFFYMDQINTIRYKTPTFSFSELLRKTNALSPFNQYLEAHDEKKAIYELKLLANIFRSTLRHRVRSLILETQNDKALIKDIKDFRKAFLELKDQAKPYPKVYQDMQHVDEFLVRTIEYYLTGYLDQHKTKQNEEIVALLMDCEAYLEDNELLPSPANAKESILHRMSLLTKFVMETLKLDTTRITVEERFGPAFGALAAGIAMTVYMTLFAIALFAYESPPFVFTSFPFILLAVILYILKDRVKESLKFMYQHKAIKWFPDNTTKIRTPTGESFGTLKEYFSFIKHKHLPKGFLNIRHQDFHDDLPAIKRHESIIKYKREVTLQQPKTRYDPRLVDLNTIFRFNVHRLIQKASNILQPYLTYDPKEKKLISEQLPRVYHLNMIIKRSYEKKTEISKFRVVIDKSGIKRVEKVT